jgi:chlorite dismutase
MIRYIFGSLRSSENTVKIIKKTLRHQAKFNLTVAFFTSVTTVYIALTEIRIYEQNKKIAEISNKLKELNHVEGE